MEKLGIISKKSDSYTIDINFSTFILFFPPKPKKTIIDVNESKQHIKANIIDVVQILEELSKDVAQQFAINNSKLYKTLDFS
jgi:hypothetical protein